MASALSDGRNLKKHETCYHERSNTTGKKNSGTLKSDAGYLQMYKYPKDETRLREAMGVLRVNLGLDAFALQASICCDLMRRLYARRENSSARPRIRS